MNDPIIDRPYRRVGGRLTSHIPKYLDGNGSIPVFQTTHATTQNPIYFTFNDELLRLLARTSHKDSSLVKDSLDAALRFGFRGRSHGEQNGIFLLRPHDEGLKRAIDTGYDANWENITAHLLAEGDDAIPETEELRRVKIVTHAPTKGRVVGLYRSQAENQIMHFYTIGTY